ncbi:hypothetical protein V8C35DRAFT_307673 [Trichoderma chlorosporum]
MMNAIGGAVSILHTVHQCFSYFQKARGFEDQLEIYLLQLRLQLDRCNTVSRIIQNSNGADECLTLHALAGMENTLEDQEPAINEILSTIQNILRKAQEEAVRIEGEFSNSGPPPPEGAADLRAMRLRMTAFLDRQKIQAAKTIEGIKWGLYKKDKHDKFITEISTLIQHLERKVNGQNLQHGETRIIYIVRDHSSITYEAEHNDV